MKGDYVLKALTQSTVTHGLCADDQLRFLSDDNSLLSSTNCQSIKCGLDSSYVGIYNHLLYVVYKFYIKLNNPFRLECDDYHVNSGFQQAGSWSFYVR